MPGEVKITIRGDDKLSDVLARVNRNLGNTQTQTGGAAGGFTNLGAKVIVANQALELAGKVLSPLVDAFKSVVSEGSAFTSQMSAVKAISKTTEEEFKALSDEALRIGASTEFSATQAAEGMEELRRAGLSTADVLETTSFAMALASATGAELSEASRVTAIQFGLFKDSVKSAEEIVDLMTQTTGASPQNFEELSKALEVSGGLASSLGISFDDLTDIFGVMAEAGFKSEKAGTALNAALARLLKPVPEVEKALARLGLTTDEVNPKTVKFREIIEKLNKAGADEADILTILGQESGPKFIQMIKRGAVALDEFEIAQKQANTANEAASERLDNLEGDTTKFTSALSGVKQLIFEQLEGPLRGVVQAGTAVLAWFVDFQRAQPDMSELESQIEQVSSQMKILENGFKDSVETLQQYQDLKANLTRLEKSRTEILARQEKELTDKTEKEAKARTDAIKKESEAKSREAVKSGEKRLQLLDRINMAYLEMSQREADQELAIRRFLSDQLIAETQKQNRIQADQDAIWREIAFSNMGGDFDRQLARLDEQHIARQEAAEGNADLLLAIEEDYQKRRGDIEVAQMQQRLAETATALGGFAALAKTYGRDGFFWYQRLATGEAIISTAASVARTLMNLPWPWSLVPAAGALAAGTAQIRTIQQQQPPAAHGGLTSVPSEQTFLLAQGERVVSPNQNADLTSFLDQAQETGAGGGDVTINISGSVDKETLGKIVNVIEEEKFISSYGREAVA